jgi:hypothetical protein
VQYLLVFSPQHGDHPAVLLVLPLAGHLALPHPPPQIGVLVFEPADAFGVLLYCSLALLHVAAVLIPFELESGQLILGPGLQLQVLLTVLNQLN